MAHRWPFRFKLVVKDDERALLTRSGRFVKLIAPGKYTAFDFDRAVRDFVEERVKALGAEIGEIGVKDVILPGDIRELLNKVVEAERIAKANLIRRQEETAATRSLLNTAKLMENNPLLLRLKELEALEKLVEKVGRIDLHTGAQGGGFEALLSKLYTIDGELAAPKGGEA